MRFVYGVNPVLEALRAHPDDVQRVLIERGKAERVAKAAAEAGVRVDHVSPAELQHRSRRGGRAAAGAQDLRPRRAHRHAGADWLAERGGRRRGRPLRSRAPAIQVGRSGDSIRISDPWDLGTPYGSLISSDLGNRGIAADETRRLGGIRMLSPIRSVWCPQIVTISGMRRVRTAAVAGSFYPGEPAEL